MSLHLSKCLCIATLLGFTCQGSNVGCNGWNSQNVSQQTEKTLKVCFFESV